MSTLYNLNILERYIEVIEMIVLSAIDIIHVKGDFISSEWKLCIMVKPFIMKLRLP